MVSSDQDREQDADFNFYGLAGQYHAENFNVGVQLGQLNSTAVDPETIDDAQFVRVTGQYFLPNNRTVIQPSLMFMKGVQDTDSVGGIDDVEISTLSLEVEHLLNWKIGDATASFVGGLERSNIREIEGDSTKDTSVMFGFRFKFGGGSVRQRSKQLAPRTVNFVRILGAVPVVD